MSADDLEWWRAAGRAHAERVLGPLRPVDVAHAALLEGGRPDLAELITWFDDEHGGYIEVTDEIMSEADYEVIDRAETLARQVIGLGPYPREVTS